jgi:uncharacterized protein
MHIEGEFTVRAAPDRVYTLFVDPVAFLDCLDDPHSVHPTDADHFEGTVTTGVSFIRGTFRLRGAYGTRTPPTAIECTLQGSGLGSGVDAKLAIRLATSEGTTSVRWEGEVTLSGPIATLGERVVRSTIDKKAAGLFENARKKLEPG